MKPFALFIFAAACTIRVFADDAPPPPEPALIERADKIVAKLGLTDSAQVDRIRLLIAQQYALLRPIHSARDNARKLAKDSPDLTEAKQRLAVADDVATGRLARANYAFVARLSAELTPAHVEAVKDGMTYGVAPNTFAVYLKMLPELTPEQRTQIHAWLLEAREHAMSAGSSEEKHGWFGKYKGRINNYLSQAGYNMKAAEKNLKQ